MNEPITLGLTADLQCPVCGRDFRGDAGDADIKPGAPCPSDDCPSFGHDGVSRDEGGSCGNQHGYHCPDCDDCDNVCITVSVEQRLVPDGTDDTDYGDMEWSDDSIARCHATGCGWQGTVADLITFEPSKQESK